MVEIRNATKDQIERALNEINKKYSGNIQFNRFDYKDTNRGPRAQVTLKVKDSHGPGAHRGLTYNDDMIFVKGRRTVSACWHVHGHFFDALFKLAPRADVVSRLHGRRIITAHNGNLEDFDIGSMTSPFYASDACDCYENGLE